MMDSRTGARWGLLVLAITLLGGCTQIENPRVMVPGEPGVTEVQSRELQRLQFVDLPIPRGFLYVSRGNRSFSYQAGGVRVGRFRYWGKAPISEVAEFYRETMPLSTYGWKETDFQSEEDASVIQFDKQKQSCEVTITKEPQGTYVELFVTGPA